MKANFSMDLQTGLVHMHPQVERLTEENGAMAKDQGQSCLSLSPLGMTVFIAES